MLGRIALTLTAVSLLSASISAKAESWFEVEVYIFERQGQSTEQWPDSPAPQINDRAVDFISPLISTDITGVATALSDCTQMEWTMDGDQVCSQALSSTSVKTYPSLVPFAIGAKAPNQAYLNDAPTLLATEQSKFKDIIRTVSREPGVKNLVHLTWQQNMTSKRRTKPIRVFAGKDFSKEFDYHGQAVSDADEPMTLDVSFNDFSQLGAVTAPKAKNPVWELDGTINIYLSHYLYIENKLALRKVGEKMIESTTNQFSQFGSVSMQSEKSLQPFLFAIPLEQNRRVRSGEIHYFDHPQMGIVMQIRKMAQPTMARPIDLSVGM